MSNNIISVSRKKDLRSGSYSLVHLISEVSDGKDDLPLRDQTNNIKVQFAYYRSGLELRALSPELGRRARLSSIATPDGARRERSARYTHTDRVFNVARISKTQTNKRLSKITGLEGYLLQNNEQRASNLREDRSSVTILRSNSLATQIKVEIEYDALRQTHRAYYIIVLLIES